MPDPNPYAAATREDAMEAHAESLKEAREDDRIEYWPKGVDSPQAVPPADPLDRIAFLHQPWWEQPSYCRECRTLHPCQTYRIATEAQAAS